MELRHLRYMLAVAEHRSFTRAAQAIHISQSTLSHQVRQLELEIGRDLFDRSGGEVTLTGAGEMLLPGVRRALEELNGAIRALKQPDEEISTNIRILVGSRVCARRVLAPVLTVLPNSSAQNRTQIEEVPAVTMAERLRVDGASYDIVIGDIQNSPAGWVFEPLYHEEIGLVVPKSHRFACRRRVRMIELHGEPLVLPTAPEPTREAFDRGLRQVGARPLVVAELNMTDALFELSALNGAAAISPYNMSPTSFDLTFISLDDPGPERTIGFMWRDPGAIPRLVRAFSQRIRKQVRATPHANDSNLVIRPALTPVPVETQVNQGASGTDFPEKAQRA